MTADHRRPTGPADAIMRTYTEPEVASLLGELRERGRKFGLIWPSLAVDSVVDGRVLVRFGAAPASTVLNLLAILRHYEKAEEAPCDS
ncbi:hypothetical protein [Streptomyces sp. CBMA156]|uniref:hypothetical protein n=1 Tax=Streptomyces sp. CBMA156 TaxID=1930280 RepID=UPI001661BCFE|nr:hypothetical protein [Streptomyces sp. CBMA156]MBD0669442.1 hypothetical protein [Streptomyces sp. CBMA156]